MPFWLTRVRAVVFFVCKNGFFYDRSNRPSMRAFIVVSFVVAVVVSLIMIFLLAIHRSRVIPDRCALTVVFKILMRLAA